MKVFLYWLICFLINLLCFFKRELQEWRQPRHEDLGIFRQYLKLREQVHITQGMCWHEKRLRGRTFRNTNISGMGKILGVNEKKKKTVQRGIKTRSNISEARKEVLHRVLPTLQRIQIG